jgi:hypothetical protein
MRKAFPSSFLVALLAIGTISLATLRAEEADFVQTNLVSDIPRLATITDPQLVNPWGVSHSITSPFWVSNQGMNTAALYAVTDQTNISKVNINPPAGFVAIPKTDQGPKDPLAKSAIRILLPSRSTTAEMVLPRISSSPI